MEKTDGWGTLSTKGQCLQHKSNLYKFLAYAVGIGLLVEHESHPKTLSACRRYATNKPNFSYHSCIPTACDLMVNTSFLHSERSRWDEIELYKIPLYTDYVYRAILFPKEEKVNHFPTVRRVLSNIPNLIKE